MAEHLASIFGTEKDRVNCPFYFKIGACRHGDRCSRIHNKPTISQTLLLQNMYQNPMMSMAPGPDGLPPQMDPRASQEHFEDFYEDIFEEMAQYGEIENLNVCDNVADHMVGSVYIKYVDEGAAALALQGLQGRFYAGRPINIEFSPVTDFREATCRQYEENTCTRGGYCNFMHLRPISRDLRKQLFGRYKRHDREEPRDDRDRGRERGGGGGSGYDRGRRDERSGGRGQRESSAERRAKIASWNKERRPEPGQPISAGGGGGYGAPAPAAAAYGGGNTISAGPQPGGGGYPAPPPQGGYPGAPPPQGGYGGAPPTHGGYGAPPPQQQGGYGGVYGQQ